MAELRKDMPAYLRRCAVEHGDIVPLRFGPARAVFINHPDLIEQVLVTDYRKYVKGSALRKNRLLFGNGLLTSEGTFWRRQRKLAQPAFHRSCIETYAGVMTAYTSEMAGGWRSGETRDMHAEITQLTMRIAGKTLFGHELGSTTSEVNRAIQVGQECMARRIGSLSLSLLPEWFPTPTNLRLRGAVRTWEKVIFAAIKDRRAGDGDGADLLAILLRARDEGDGSRMTDRQLRDEMLTLFLAGHETTANALTFALYLLSQHPEVEARLAAELQTVLGGRIATPADRERLVFTEWVILEAMRLYPPAWALSRTAIENCSVGDYPVRKGQNVLISQWVMHRDGRYFDEPDRFAPERWAGDFARRLPKYAYFPFGGGPRVCIGAAFAQMETTLILATLMQAFRYRLVKGFAPTPRAAITLHPMGGMPMVLRQAD